MRDTWKLLDKEVRERTVEMMEIGGSGGPGRTGCYHVAQPCKEPGQNFCLPKVAENVVLGTIGKCLSKM